MATCSEQMNLLRAIRHDAVAPFGLFLKFNPNACDVGLFTLDQRIEVLVKRCDAFLSTPVSFFAGAAIRLAPVTSRIVTQFLHTSSERVLSVISTTLPGKQ